MGLKKLKKISFTNNLKDAVRNVVILYCESNKSIHKWFNIGNVDVETLNNTLWTRCISFDKKITSGSKASTSAGNVCFGDNFGYWQIYFSCNGEDYKLEKNDCKMTLLPECDQRELDIQLSSSLNDNKELDMMVKLQILSLSEEFKVVKGKPIVRGVNVCINNQLENDIDFISAVIVEENSSKKANQLNPNDVKFDKNNIKQSGRLTSSEFVPYNCFGHKHYLKLYFTSQGYCHELENHKKYCHGIPLKLMEKDYGGSIEITICTYKQSASLKVQNSSEKEFPLIKGSISERKKNIGELVLKIQESSKIEDKMMPLISSLSELSKEAYGRGVVSKKWLLAENESPKMFCESKRDKDSNSYKEEMLGEKKVVKIATGLEFSKFKPSLIQVFDNIDSLRAELNNLNEMLTPLKHLLETIDSDGDNDLCGIVDDLRMVQSMLIIDVICKILIPSGLDGNGLTFYTSKSEVAKEVSVDPGKLAAAVEEELDCFKISRFSRNSSEQVKDKIVLKKLITHQNDLIRLVELFVLLRKELIACLNNIAEELHYHTRNVNISMVASSSLGIVGAGFAVSGLILAPFTAGISLAMVATGVAVGATSGAVGVGTTIADGVLTQKCLDSTVSLAMNDQYVCNLLSKLQPLIKKETSLLQDSKMLPNFSETQDKFYFRVLNNVTDALSNAGVIAIKTGIQVAKTAAFRIGSVVVGVIFDLTTLAFKSIKLSKGGRSELGYKIESDALLLDQELRDSNFQNVERLSSKNSTAEMKNIADYLSNIL